ncbi:TAXI family TRAP transporter solute-binding subunit [Halomonas sp. HMF6819]|uniref:TAXI family TRAP transporter solute-binding subunit n=1 Tax=Halomonas sp. HMF6819 TaxID=3373085 RepID=UPI0037A107F7
MKDSALHPDRRKLNRFAALLVATALSSGAYAQTLITFKSSSVGTAYYQMGIELSEVISAATEEDFVLSLEESRGSVENVMEVAARQGNYVLTTPPGVIEQALAGEGPFAQQQSPRFDDIRGLFPIPPMTMHFVLAGDHAPTAIESLAGKYVLVGSGTFSAREAQRYFELFGLTGDIRLADAALDNGPQALMDGKIDAFVTASTFPTPNVTEVATSVPITLLSLTEEQIAQTGELAQVIPGGTYPGVDEDVHTTSLPVLAYTTTQMDDDTAYRLTRAFWESREALIQRAVWWGAVTPDQLQGLAAPLHPGALRYYDEAGIEIDDTLR